MALSIGELVGFVRLDTTGVTRGAATTTATMAGIGRNMDTLGGRSAGAFGKVGGAIKGVGLALGGIGLAKAATGVVGLEAMFSKNMALIAASTGAPKAEVGKLSDLAMKLGADTSFSAGEASGAMLELAKAGISTSDIMGGALSGTLTLAAAGGADLATSATIASNAMNTFGLQGKDMSSIAAALAGGANASSASVESLGQALQQVGPGATNAGLSLQETVATLAAFDAAGIKGSDAGTSLKTMLQNLVPATAEASKAMQQYGLMQYDATNASKMLNELGLKAQSKSYADVSKAVSDYLVQQGVAKEGTAALAKATDDALVSSGAMHSAFVKSDGSFKNVAQTAQILQNKLGGLSESQRQQALTQIFGSDASRAATVLMKQGKAGIEKYVKATKDQSAAQKMAKANMSGTSGALEKMKGSIETAGLALGQALAPAVQKGAAGIGAMAGGVAKATKFLSDHKGVAITLGAVIGGLTAITMAHSAAMAVAASGGMAKWLMQTKLISSATKVWTAVQWAFNAAMAANPLVLVALGLAALVAAFVVAYKKSETFRAIVQGAMDGVRNAAGAVFGWFKSKWPLLLVILTGPIGLAALAIGKNWDKIKSGASAVVDWIRGIPGKISALGSKFGDAGRELLQKFIDGMKNAAGIITGIAGNVWSAVAKLLNGAIDKINAALDFKISLPGPDIHVNVPDIPHLALRTGGRTRANSPGMAWIGDANEPESVLRDSQLKVLLREAVAEATRGLQPAMAGGGLHIDKVVQQRDEDPHVFAERVWFLTQTRG